MWIFKTNKKHLRSPMLREDENEMNRIYVE